MFNSVIIVLMLDVVPGVLTRSEYSLSICHSRLLFFTLHICTAPHTHTHTHTLVQCAFRCRLCMINSTEILLPAVILYGKNERNQTVMCIASSSLAIFQFLNILSTNVFIEFIHLSDRTSHPLPPALTHSCRIIRCVCGICVIPFGTCLMFNI